MRLAQHSGDAILSQVAASATASCIFVIPESARDLEFADLPASKRLERLVRVAKLHQLGDLDGRGAVELLRCSNIGIGTMVELQRLVTRACRGEFNGVAVAQSSAPAALLSLIEAGLSALPLRDRDLLLDRMGARGIDPVTLEQLGREHRLTPERVRQVAEETLTKLRKAWGRRIPHLLESVKERCVSARLPLTAELLEHWMGGVEVELQLSARTHLRLISALDPKFPCWPSDSTAAEGGEVSPCFALSLRTMVFAVEGGLYLSAVYENLLDQPAFRKLSFAAFLRMLSGMPDVIVAFDQPDAPVVRMRSPNEWAKAQRGGLPTTPFSWPPSEKEMHRTRLKMDEAIQSAA